MAGRFVAASIAVLGASWTVAVTPPVAAAANPAGLERVVVSSAADSLSPKSASALCPVGKTVTGVGGEIFGGRGQAGLGEYTHAERQWGVAGGYEDDDGAAGNWSVTAYAICAGGPERQWVFGQSPADSTANKRASASCPAGTVLTGGGGSLRGAGSDLVLDDVIPSADLKTVTVEAFEDQDGTSQSWLVAASARCGAPLPGQQRVSAMSSSDSVSPKSVTASCPAGQRVIGTGSEIFNGRGQVVLDDVVPSADLTSVRVEAFEDQDGTGSNWSVTAYAICAD